MPFVHIVTLRLELTFTPSLFGIAVISCVPLHWLLTLTSSCRMAVL